MKKNEEKMLHTSEIHFVRFTLFIFTIAAIFVLMGCNQSENNNGNNSDNNPIDDATDNTNDSSANRPDELTAFEEEVLDTILSRQYLDNTKFLPINNSRYATDLNDTQDISLYVSKTGSSLYSLVDPNLEGSKVIVPEGTMIVREVWDKEGNFLKYTVMAKREEGYFPESGDFYFASIDNNGNFIDDSNGNPQSGPLEACSVCHIPRANDGYLFGVPEAHKDDTNSDDTLEAIEQRLDNLAVASVFQRSYQQMMDRINRIPVISSLNQFQLINTYLSPQATNEYQQISPDLSGTNPNLSEESIIVREVFDLQTQKTKLTVMIKGPEGYNPEVGDFYFAVLNEQGEFLEDADGSRQSGTMPDCAVCHIARGEDGYLFGVSEIYK